MKIYSVLDPEFAPYGHVVQGMEDTVQEILSVLGTTPMPEAGVCYVAEDPALQELPAATEVSEYLYGGAQVQLGWCNGYNTKLNCLEYHRCSEFNLGTEPFILLLAQQQELENGCLDTGKVKAFRVPAGVMVECYATTLHYAPCHTDPQKGYRVLVVLPSGTNEAKPVITGKTPEDKLLWGCNKWLVAHKDAPEAAQGAFVGLVGENLDIAELI